MSFEVHFRDPTDTRHGQRSGGGVHMGGGLTNRTVDAPRPAAAPPGLSPHALVLAAEYRARAVDDSVDGYWVAGVDDLAVAGDRRVERVGGVDVEAPGAWNRGCDGAGGEVAELHVSRSGEGGVELVRRCRRW